MSVPVTERRADERPPRVAFWGNVANALFPLVTTLRANGIDAHLLVDPADPPRWRPEADDPSLADGYPDWIHEGRWIQRAHYAAPWRSPAVELLADFDLVVGSGNTPMVAPFLRTPFAFFTTGADLTKQPFPIAFRHTRSGAVDLAGHVALAAWQRRGIRAAAEVWTQPFRPFLDALDRLGVDRGRVADAYFPLIVDTDLFAPLTADGGADGATPMGAAGPTPDWAADLASQGDLVVLHPSRLVLDDAPHMLRSGQTKGSAVTLQGFADLVRSGVADHPVLVIPGIGGERDEADALIRSLDITDHVVFAAPPRPSGFHRSEMVHLYRAADVTVNEFGAGWFGWAALESMACGVPVISRIDHAGIRRLYGDDHEWLHAQDAADLTAHLVDLVRDPAAGVERGRRSRAWIERHHAPDTAGRRITRSVEEALVRLGARDSAAVPIR